MIKQIGLPLRGRPILLITRMITDRIALHSGLLPLLIIIVIIIIIIIIIIVVVLIIIIIIIIIIVINYYLPPAKTFALAVPKVEQATRTGIVQAITPYKRLAKI